MESTNAAVRDVLAEHASTINVECYRAFPMFRGSAMVDIDDLRSIAQYAVLVAIEKHDPALGSMRGYLKTAIRRRLIDEARNNSLYSRDELEQHKREEWKSANRFLLSMDAPRAGDDDATLHDFLGAEGGHLATEDAMLMGKAEQMMEKLPPRQAQIMRMNIEGHSLTEIGNILGVSVSRVCQLLKRANQNMVAIRDTGQSLQGGISKKLKRKNAQNALPLPAAQCVQRSRGKAAPTLLLGNVTNGRKIHKNPPKGTIIYDVSKELGQCVKPNSKTHVSKRILHLIRTYPRLPLTMLGQLVYSDFATTSGARQRLGMMLSVLKHQGFIISPQRGVWIPNPNHVQHDRTP